MYERTDYDLVYVYGGTMSHVLPHGLPIALCGAKPPELVRTFFGLRGNERNKAKKLPICPACVDANNLLNEESYNLNRD